MCMCPHRAAWAPSSTHLHHGPFTPMDYIKNTIRFYSMSLRDIDAHFAQISRRDERDLLVKKKKKGGEMYLLPARNTMLFLGRCTQ